MKLELQRQKCYYWRRPEDRMRNVGYCRVRYEYFGSTGITINDITDYRRKWRGMWKECQ